MSATAIDAHGLSKRYRVPAVHADLAGDAQLLDSGARRISRTRRSLSDGWIEAVSDLSFEIKTGEAVGLIGRNGAGKSTLLKLLSRVTRPSAGYADVYGRVGALLEVGTGFHPELTGRENAFLSGAILGMARRDIRARFDQIVAFAEIAPFIDMPVKHYSSGMYARLGFAVAAFLKPDILIVDEILSVGDLAFQAKCLAHMRGLPRDGTTVLFVSHNLLAMADLCPRAMVMADGALLFDGPTSEAIGAYRRMVDARAASTTPVVGRPAHDLRINGRAADATIECRPNDRLLVDLEVDQPADAVRADIELNLVVEMPDGRMAIHLRNDLDSTRLTIGPGHTTLSVEIDDLALVPGSYSLWLRVVSLDVADPVIWDTDRVQLLIQGDNRLSSIVQPRYRFAERLDP